MRHDQRLFERAQTPDTRLPRVVASARATAALLKLRHCRGPQVIVLGASWATVSIAHVRDGLDFYQDEYHVGLGVVAHCPVYADIRATEFCPHDTLVIDTHATVNGGGSVFVARPESQAERQQRVFVECAHSNGLR